MNLKTACDGVVFAFYTGPADHGIDRTMCVYDS